MKLMTIIVWGVDDENSRSYELKKKNQVWSFQQSGVK